jgi:AbrB family looped-hinge helix DNA binding protein
MKTGAFIAEVDSQGKITLPVEIKERLELREGDKVEILLKKIRRKRLEVTIGKNPLYKLLQLTDSKE